MCKYVYYYFFKSVDFERLYRRVTTKEVVCVPRVRLPYVTACHFDSTVWIIIHTRPSDIVFSGNLIGFTGFRYFSREMPGEEYWTFTGGKKKTFQINYIPSGSCDIPPETWCACVKIGVRVYGPPCPPKSWSHKNKPVSVKSIPRSLCSIQNLKKIVFNPYALRLYGSSRASLGRIRTGNKDSSCRLNVLIKKKSTVIRKLRVQ